MPGAAALVAHGEDVEIAGAGELEPDSIVRIASITKPITAAAVMLLVDEELVSLDDPIARWLPELASPRVVRTPQSAIDDVVPAGRPITVEDILTFRAGWGFPVRLLAAGGRRALPEAPGVRAAGNAGRVAHDARAGADAPPAGRGVALQHLLRHPGRLDRTRLGAAAAGVPRRAHLRAPRDERHRLPRSRGEARPAAAVPWPRSRADRRRALDGAADLPVGRRRPRSRRSPTGIASGACCSRTAAGCSRLSRCA